MAVETSGATVSRVTSLTSQVRDRRDSNVYHWRL